MWHNIITWHKWYKSVRNANVFQLFILQIALQWNQIPLKIKSRRQTSALLKRGSNTNSEAKPPVAALYRYLIVSPHTINSVLSCVFAPNFLVVLPETFTFSGPDFSWNGNVIMTQQAGSITGLYKLSSQGGKRGKCLLSLPLFLKQKRHTVVWRFIVWTVARLKWSQLYVNMSGLFSPNIWA